MQDTITMQAVVGLAGGVGILLWASPAPLAAQAKPAAGSLVFDHVTVVDVEQGRRTEEQRVVVTGNRITALGPVGAVPVPGGARVIDARGKYLIPGLWDMHVHVINAAEEYFPEFIAHGVTGIREMGQRGERAGQFHAIYDQVFTGELVGPRGIGPSADVSTPVIAQGMTSPEGAIRVVDSLKAAGDAFIKFHGSPDDRAIYFALLRESRRVGIPVVGHIPSSVTPAEASDSGVRSIEHGLGCLQNAESFDSAAVERDCGPIVRTMIRNGTWLTPTVITTYETMYMNPQYGQVDIDVVLRALGTMRRLGLKNILAGTDVDLVPPGVSLLQELMLRADAGFTPLEVLQSATLNPAKFLGITDSLGTVAPGKLADLVLLDGDPLANIVNVLRLRAVVANGRYFDRTMLESLDREGAQTVQQLIQANGRLQRLPKHGADSARGGP